MFAHAFNDEVIRHINGIQSGRIVAVIGILQGVMAVRAVGVTYYVAIGSAIDGVVAVARGDGVGSVSAVYFVIAS